MTLLTERFPTNPDPVSVEGGVCGERPAALDLPMLSALDPFLYQQMRWCVNCGGQQIFVEVYETDFGRVGVCLGCGEERVVRFTRTMEAV